MRPRSVISTTAPGIATGTRKKQFLPGAVETMTASLISFLLPDSIDYTLDWNSLTVESDVLIRRWVTGLLQFIQSRG